MKSVSRTGTTQKEKLLKGIPSSPGTAVGKSFVIKPEKVVVPTVKISESEIDSELERFASSTEELIKEFDQALGKVGQQPKEVGDIISANIIILKDPFFIESVQNIIKTSIAAESAVIQSFDAQMKFFKHSNDRILREKAAELDHLKERLLAALRNRNIFHSACKDSIVVANSLTPTDIVHFKEIGIAGLVTEVGGIAGHVSILARSLEIPAVIGVKNATSGIKNGKNIVMNGFTGTVITNPSDETRLAYRKKKADEIKYKRKLGKLVKLPSETRDGKKIHLLANIDFTREVENAVKVGAEGIGLVRTEHMIFPVKVFPSIEEQYDWYNKLSERIYPHPVTIRVFDVGSDKYAEGIPKHEDNPALGFRGIRFLLSRKDLFEIQVKAILRASKNKNVRLLLPMISNIGEVLESIDLVEKCKVELDAKGIHYDHNLPIGVMIETPAAVMLAPDIACHVDYFSIGTNDLTQYTLAADRTNELVADIFDPFHPAVLRMIKSVIDAAKANNVKVGLCGEIAGHAAATELLIGMGIEELSVPPSVLLELKSRIRNTDMTRSKRIAGKALNAFCMNDIREILHNGYKA